MDGLSERIEGVARETDFAGVVSIQKNGKPFYNRAFGYGDIKNKRPNRVTTKFGIASGTKLFTAVAIGRLVDAGALALNTRMRDIDLEFSGFIDENATILHLLSHTSGVYDYYDEEQVNDSEDSTVEIPWAYLTTPSDYLPLFRDKPMKFRPGERYSYSNGGYVLLGVIIERVSGQMYRHFVERNVLANANMSNTGFFAFNDLPEDTAIGYLADRCTSNIYHLPLRGGGDGGMYTTVDDLQSFWMALIEGRLLSPALRDAFLETRHTFDGQTGYGCGVYKRLDNSGFWIVGCDVGVGFFSKCYVYEKTTVSVISNATNGEANLVRVIVESLENGS